MPNYKNICPCVSAKYGAPMGRPQRVGTLAGLKLRPLPMDGEGYDRGGAYWGIRPRGERIYVAYHTDGTTWLSYAARSLADAARQVLGDYPEATIKNIKG